MTTPAAFTNAEKILAVMEDEAVHTSRSHGMTAQDIAELVGLSASSVRSAMPILEAEGHVGTSFRSRFQNGAQAWFARTDAARMARRDAKAAKRHDKAVKLAALRKARAVLIASGIPARVDRTRRTIKIDE
jgi:predicted ArsR family transcriptional regulator